MVEVEIFEQDAGLNRVDQLVSMGRRSFPTVPRTGDLVRVGKLQLNYEVLAVIHNSQETERPGTILVVRDGLNALEDRLKK